MHYFFTILMCLANYWIIFTWVMIYTIYIAKKERNPWYFCWLILPAIPILVYMSRALVIREDTIYIKDYSNVFAVNSDGTEKWSLEIDKGPISGPVIGKDDALYLGVGDIENSIYIIDSDEGDKKREIPVAVTALTEVV